MKRKQLYLDGGLDRALKPLAARTRRSEASHVRGAVRDHMAEPADADDDPLLLPIGLVDDPDGPTDVAMNHDHDVYGAPKDEP